MRGTPLALLLVPTAFPRIGAHNMSLILAIEPDRRQSLTLTSLSRARLNVELVLGETVGRAFDALGPRRPDLVLTSPHLTPKDESTLASRLRGFEAAGTPIPRLIIPRLGPSLPDKKTKGGKAKGLAAHCDPMAFSEQIADCLEMASAEQAALAAAQAELEAAWAVDVETTRPARPTAPAETASTETTSAAVAAPPASRQVEPPSSGPAPIEPEPPAFDGDEMLGAPAVQVEPVVHIEPVVDGEPRLVATPMSDWSQLEHDEVLPGCRLDAGNDWEELALDPSPTSTGVSHQPSGGYSAGTDDFEMSPVIELDLQTVSPPEEAIDQLEEAVDQLEEAVDQPEWVGVSLDPTPTESAAAPATALPDSIVALDDQDPGMLVGQEEIGADALLLETEAVVSQVLDTTPVTIEVTDEVVAATASPVEAPLEPDQPAAHEVAFSMAAASDELGPGPGAAIPEPIAADRPAAVLQDVLSAIRRDIQHLRGDEGESPRTPDADDPSTDSPARHWDRRDSLAWRPKMTPRLAPQVLPVQDEWGFFDPQQCGFEALRAKLNEMLQKKASM